VDIQELICHISNFPVLVCKSVEVKERRGRNEESGSEVTRSNLVGNVCDVV